MIPTKLMSQNHTYSKVMIESPDKTTDAKVLSILHSCTFHRLPMSSGNNYSAIVNQDQLRELTAKGIKHTIITADVSTTVTAESTPKQKSQILKNAREKYRFQNFNFGSFKGFYTYDEVVAELDNMHKNYPKLVSQKESIGKTYKKRDIWAVKIGSNIQETQGNNKPKVLFTSLIHAREPQSMATVIYFMYYLLENYYTGSTPPEGVDPLVKPYVDGLESHFIPVLNPDGYNYNYQEYQKYLKSKGKEGALLPARRKNMSLHTVSGKSYVGVDLNRNFGTDWKKGTHPEDETYPGPNAFSELETKAIRNYCNTHKFTASNDWHSYSDTFLYPWGAPLYHYLPYPANITFPKIAFNLSGDVRPLGNHTQPNFYEWGGVWQSMYVANGDINAWMYKECQIYSMGGEVGRLTYTFSDIQNKISKLGWTSKKQKKDLKNALEKQPDIYGTNAFLTQMENILGKATVNKHRSSLTIAFYDPNTYDGFYPKLDRIIPLAVENVQANLFLGLCTINLHQVNRYEKGQDTSEKAKKAYENAYYFKYYLDRSLVGNIIKLFNNDFYCASNTITQGWANPGGVGIPNSFKMTEAQNGFIDKTTKLQWLMLSQGSGMKQSMSYQLLSTSYLTDINTTKAEGHSDWRLPTLEEAMTLVQAKAVKNSHMPEVLQQSPLNLLTVDNTIGLWTSDYESKDTVWAVNLTKGYCYPMDINTDKASIPLLLVRSYRNDNGSGTTR